LFVWNVNSLTLSEQDLPMAHAIVSVIIPVYNGAGVVGEAVQSVLAQSYRDLEVLVIDDASTDGSPDVVRKLDDPRLKLIRHPCNMGADAARKTGLDASSGDIIAFLDQDDIFHADKLLVHVEYLKGHPEVGLTYNPYFVMSHPSRTLQGIERPPEAVRLEDVLLGFPIPPSVTVIRRPWALREELWEKETFYRGREVVFCGRLLLAGCQMAIVNRVLNWRREFVRRTVKDILRAAGEEIRCQDILLEDPRCPGELRALRSVARANTWLEFAYIAFRQGDEQVGQRLLKAAADTRPELLGGRAAALLRFLLLRSTSNAAEDHEGTLRPALAGLARVCPEAADGWERLIGEGYLYRGSRAAIWGEPKEAAGYLRTARAAGIVPGGEFADVVCHEMWSYECEFGRTLAAQRLGSTLSLLAPHFGRTFSRHLRARYWFNRALRGCERGERWQVVKDCVRAVRDDAGYLRNRGTASMLLQAIAGSGAWRRHRSRWPSRRGVAACTVRKADDFA
jgi:glycosyltransferase involved in cell wall biosynthesis